MTKPTILLVPGLWEGPTVFSQVISSLSSLGYPTETAPLISTGTRSPGNPGMKDDTAAIRLVVQKLVEEEEKEVVMVLHSAGGFLGSSATEGLTLEKRAQEGKTGGVRKFVFLCAGIMPLGQTHVDLPFFDLETGKEAGEMYCADARKLLFNDLSPSETEKWLRVLQPQPLSDWNDKTTYTGWAEIPSVYLICENDQILPIDYQLQAATVTDSKVERCNSGHSVMLSMPEKVVEVVVSAAEDT